MTKKPQPPNHIETAAVAAQRVNLNRINAELEKERQRREEGGQHHVDAFYRSKSKDPRQYPALLVECRALAKQLHENFRHGNKLAPFECAAMWRRRRLPAATLPEWVADAVMYDVAARYFDRAIGCLAKHLPLPSMRQVAGLSGTQKRFTAFNQANRDNKAKTFSEAYRTIVALTRGETPRPEDVETLDPTTGQPTEQFTRPGITKYVNNDGTFRAPDGDVPILNEQGHVTVVFTIALARLFNVSSPRDDDGRLDDGQPLASDDAVYRAARRLLRPR